MSQDPIPCPHCGEPLPSPDELPERCPHCQDALILANEYKLVRVLGLGAVSTVYEAQRLSDQREVALKVLQPQLKDDPQIKRLFEESTHILQDLHHAQVPEVFDFIEEPSMDQHILVLEALEGKTLYDRIFIEQRRIPAERAEKFFISLLELLAYLQTRPTPLLHRNIQPANIMFRTPDDWIPILVDFDHVLAQADVAKVANPEYASKEQLEGQDSEANDLYSLALTTLVILSAKSPDQLRDTYGANLGVSKLAVQLPPDTREVLSRMLSPEPSRRFKDARSALSALYARRVARENRRRHALISLGVVAVLLLCAVIWLNKDQFSIGSQEPAAATAVTDNATP